MSSGFANIPKTAPFSEEDVALLNRVVGPASAVQRAWLAGFLAGVESATGQPAQPAAPAHPAEPLTIVYASESGNSEKLAGDALARDLAQRLQGFASISDQHGGRTVLRLSGPRAREVLAKGLPIDLHPRAFGPGSAATSTISLMGVQLWQVDEAPSYDIALFRSVSESFWRWLTSSAAEFGYEVTLPQGD